jgi:hypothetical protein
MPSSCSKVVRKQQPKPVAKQAQSRRRKKPTLRVLASPSPFISDGTTTEADLCKWADWFARFHTDPMELYIPLALRTVDCVVTVQRQPPTGSLPPRLMHCVREVAKFNGAEGVEWKLITWVPGLPGAQFEPCATLNDAMRLLRRALQAHPCLRAQVWT